MADQEFQIQAGICGGNWWSSASKSVFTAAAAPCSVGSFGWPNHDLLDLKAARSSSGDETTTTTTTDHIFQEVIDHDHDQKPHHLQSDHNNISVSGSGSNILIDSTLQMMGFGLSSSPTSDFTNQTFVSRSSTGRAESNNNNIYSMLEQDMGTKLNYRQETGLDSSQIQKDWTRTTTSPPKDFSGDIVVDSSTVTSQALSAGFPVASSPFGYTSATLLQNLFEGETTTTTTNTNTATQPLQQQQQPFCNNYLPSSGPNFGSNNIWPRFSPLILGSRPSPPLKQQPGTGLHFSNNTPFWNASSPGLNDGVFPSTQPRQIRYVTPKFEENYKPKCNNLTNPKVNSINEDVHDSGSVGKKSSGTSGISENQPVLKRPRIETPSPLPTFKVRKEKLGDRITALQQLVSPFGKTDTASVLHEAIEYIKFLHDQVSVLSSPYMKNGASIQVHQQGSNKLKDQDESPKQDLKSRGLCLVPISSTFPVANETTADFWTPTSSFGATFR